MSEKSAEQRSYVMIHSCLMTVMLMTILSALLSSLTGICDTHDQLAEALSRHAP